MQITEYWIVSHAPNPETAENARMLSEDECFSARQRAEETETYWAECAGSAPNPYHVSLDWSLPGEEPVYSCSCPSKQTPCKHVLGLMYEILMGKSFETARTPFYVARVRAREAAKRGKAQARLERARKHDAVAREKRLNRKLEGLAKAEKTLNTILKSGLGAGLSGFPTQPVERLATELGNWEIPGARDALGRAVAAERRVRLEGADEKLCRGELLRALASLHTLIREGSGCLEAQLAEGRGAMENPMLFELLGGEWDMDELYAMGSFRNNARMLQLSFDVLYDEARRVRVERSFWMELTRGGIVHTINERSSKLTEGGTSDDTSFELLEIPVLYETPGAVCPRVWWGEAIAREPLERDYLAVRALAAVDVATAVKSASQSICEPLLPGCAPVFVRVGRIGRVGGALVLEDGEGGRIELRDRRADGADHASTCRLAALAEPPEEGDAIFGLAFYDEPDRRYCLHPYSLAKANDIIRLQF